MKKCTVTDDYSFLVFHFVSLISHNTPRPSLMGSDLNVERVLNDLTTTSLEMSVLTSDFRNSSYEMASLH